MLNVDGVQTRQLDTIVRAKLRDRVNGSTDH